MSDQNLFNGIELLLRLIDAATAASAKIKQARDEGRDLTAAEVLDSLEGLQTDLLALDRAIAERRAG